MKNFQKMLVTFIVVALIIGFSISCTAEEAVEPSKDTATEELEKEKSIKDLLAESERKQAFYDLAELQDSVPLDDPDWSEKQEEAYKIIARSYGINEDQMREIVAEGITENWPMPAIQEETIVEEVEEKETTEEPNEKQDDDAVLAEIREKAEADWPGDKSMQDFQYSEQVKAFNYIKGLTEHSEIIEKAEHDWPNDYVMQEFQYGEQVKSKEYMLSLGDEHSEIIEKAEHDWPNDYVMQEFQYGEQVKSKEYMASIPDNDPKKQKAIRDWPDDYVMQEFQYNN